MEALVKCLFPAASLPASKTTISEITTAINELPPDNQRPLRMQYLEGMTRKQIAESLGWTLSKVHRKITRGSSLIKRRLGLIKPPSPLLVLTPTTQN
jgi:DNA-directed RNA polymerase specialized sigma24 family protein